MTDPDVGRAPSPKPIDPDATKAPPPNLSDFPRMVHKAEDRLIVYVTEELQAAIKSGYVLHHDPPEGTPDPDAALKGTHVPPAAGEVPEESEDAEPGVRPKAKRK